MRFLVLAVALVAPGCISDEPLADERDPCADPDSWWRFSVVGGARASPAEPLYHVRLESDAWAQWERENPPPPPERCPVMTPYLEGDPLPEEAWRGPILVPGDRDVLQLVVDSNAAFPMESWTVRVDVPAGLRLVDGEAAWQGEVPPTGLLLVWVVEVVEPGRWTVVVTAGPPGGASAQPSPPYLVRG